MPTSPIETAAARLTPLQWAICITAAIGFAFDSYVLLMLPLIIRPALVELLHVPAANPAINSWVGNLFNVPAIAGGIFGLLGGYLTDIFGRRRILVWSILLYAISGVRGRLFDVGPAAALLAMLHVRRRVRRIRRRGRVAVRALRRIPNSAKRSSATRQAFGSLGGVMVTAAYYLVVTYADHAAAGPRRARGLALHADVGHRPGDPADRHSSVPAGVARPGARRRAAGTLKRPSFGELFRPRVPPDDDRHHDHDGVRVRRGVRRDSAGAAHRAGPGGSANAAAPGDQEQTVSAVQSFQEFGGLAGRIVLAFLAVQHRQPAAAAAPVPESRA